MSRQQRPTPSDLSLAWLNLLVIFVIGLLMRLYCLDCHSLWYDEIASIETAQRGVNAIFTYRSGWLGNQTHLHYLLVWLTILPLDPASSPLLVRLPSALAGSLTPLLVFGIGRILFENMTALIAVFLTSLSLVLLDYSQDVRPYSMLAFLTVASAYCLLMAASRGSAKWWWYFGAVTTVNLLYSYFASVLVLPALVPFLLYALVRVWRRRKESGYVFYAALAATGVTFLVSVVMITALRSTSSITPRIDGVSPVAVWTGTLGLTRWFTQFGLEGQVATAAVLICLLVSLFGTYRAVRLGGSARQGVLLCWAMIVIPAALLALLQSTHLVFERYAIFGAPFYFLLVGNGLGSVWAWVTALEIGRPRYAGAAAAAIATLLVALCFALGSLNFVRSSGMDKLSAKPDYRSVASYLSGKVTEDDVMVFVDEPAHGATVTGFYGLGLPRVAAYNLRDPRLFALNRVSGSIYWVVCLVPDKAHIRDHLAEAGQAWADVQLFDGATVLRETAGGRNIKQVAAEFVANLEKIDSNNPSVRILRASVQQAQGEISQAAQTYREVGAYTPLGDEHLRTAQGLASIGEEERAWQEAVLAKHAQPDRVEMHQLMADMLREQGYAGESQIESQIAGRLEGRR